MFNVGLISRWHPHASRTDARYVKQFLQIPGCQICCVWDEVVQRGSDWAEELSVDFEPSLDTLLARQDLDGIICTAPTSMHKDIFIKAAKAGKHIFTEKTLTLTLEDALEVREAIQEAGVQFVISFPRIFTPALGYAKALIDKGVLGDVCRYRILVGHRGALNGDLEEYWFDPEVTGGGAMMDLGCHPVYLALWTLGRAQSVDAVFTSILGKRVEDNANCTVRFASGALASLESTFTTAMLSTFELSVYGTKGSYYTLMPDGDKVCLKLDGQPAQWLDKSTLPPTGRMPMEQWVAACTKHEPIHYCGIDAAIEVVRFMVAAYSSAKECRQIHLDNL